MREVGRWTEANGEAIYGVSPGPDMRWEANIDMVTRRPEKDYLHIFDWPEDAGIFYQYPFYQYERGLKRVYLLADDTEVSLPVQEFRRAVRIEVPKDAPDPINSVLVIEYQ